jgi:hypothetical protein
MLISMPYFSVGEFIYAQRTASRDGRECNLLKQSKKLKQS